MASKPSVQLIEETLPRPLAYAICVFESIYLELEKGVTVVGTHHLLVCCPHSIHPVFCHCSWWIDHQAYSRRISDVSSGVSMRLRLKSNKLTHMSMSARIMST